MESIVRRLAGCALFRGLPEDLLQRELIPLGHIKNYKKDCYLLSPQQQLDHFGILLQGRIHTMHIFFDGSLSIMDVLEKNEVFGVDLLSTKSRISPYHAVAAEDTTLFSFPWFLPFTQGHLSETLRLELQLRLLHLVANGNMQKEYRLAILSQKGLRERIVTYLQMQAVKRNVKTFTIPFSREEMASYLCVNRSALSHELGKMQAEGLISFHKNRFTLLKLE